MFCPHKNFRHFCTTWLDDKHIGKTCFCFIAGSPSTSLPLGKIHQFRSTTLNCRTIWTNHGIKHRKNRKTLPRELLIGCQGVKMFLLKDAYKKFFSSSHKLIFVIVRVLWQIHFFLVLSKFEFLSLLQFELSFVPFKF